MDETFACYERLREHYKHLKSMNRLERLNQEIERRTLLTRISPDDVRCLPLVQALAVKTRKEWVDENCHLTKELLRVHQKRPPQPKPA